MLDLNDQLDLLNMRSFSLFFSCFSLNTAGGNPSSIKSWSQQYHYYDGDEHDPNVQATIKDKFYQLLMSSYLRPIFCQSDPGLCSKDELLVYPEINGKS